MARSRNIKPGFFKNEYLAELDPLARILFAGLWTLADSAGRLEDRPQRIKADILPYDDCDVDALLDCLAKSRDKFIIRYELDGVQYIQITNFLKHQNPHKKEKESEIPPPNCCNDSLRCNTDPEKNGTSPENSRPSTGNSDTSMGKSETSPADSFNLIPDSGFLIADSFSKDRASICKFYEQHFPGSMTSTMMEHVNTYLEDGMEAKLILLAMDKAVQVDKRTFAYVRGILNDWLNKNILTEKAAIDEELMYQKGKKGGAAGGKHSRFEPDDPREYGIYIDGVKV